MIWSLCLTLTGAILALAVARYAASPTWIHALIASGVLFGLALGIGVGLAARRLGGPRWHGGAALVVSLAAAATRFLLVAHIELEGRPVAELWPLMLACASVGWGTLALLWGTVGVMDSFEPVHLRRLLLSAVAVSVSLYSLSPLWGLFGLRINHWTLLGLFGLSTIAWGTAVLFRRLFAIVDRRR